MLLAGILLGGLLGGISGMVSGAAEGTRRHNEAEARQREYRERSAEYKARADKARSNARFTLQHGKRQMSSYADQINRTITEGERLTGAQTASIGSSAVTMSGSAQGAVRYSQKNLRKDIQAIERTRESMWSRTMQERSTYLQDMRSFNRSASFYASEAEEIDPDAEYQNSFWGGLFSGLLSGLSGGLL